MALLEIDIRPLSVVGGCTTTCIVVTVPGASHKGLWLWHSPTVLLFSNIFPALIIFKSFIVLGPISLSSKHKTNSYKQ
ncbi:membrane-anchored ubiquitin-fold protein [Trifolium repens]|nr:membrane-anchored ubiquitin-fold protein [Trifolium repens]